MSARHPTFGFGLRHPLAQSFLVFDVLPSRLLHVSQFARLITDAGLRDLAGGLLHWHRHWSAALVLRCQLDPVHELADPALPLAMLPAEGFERVLRLAGAVLAGPCLRRCIVRDDVALVRQQLGDEVLDFARHRALALHPGVPMECALPETAATVQVLGEAVLARAFSGAAPSVGRRALLRLSVDAPVAAARVPIEPDGACRLLRSLLPTVDPRWLSLFPASR